jgi:hypothetical protein
VIAIPFETPPPSRSSAGVVEEVEVEAVVEDAGKDFTFPGPAANDAKLLEEM